MVNKIIVKNDINFSLFVSQIVPSDMEGSSVHSDPEGSELSEGRLNYQQAQLEQQNIQDEATEESKKAVSFMTSASNEQLQVEDQTPLIFSRSSSFESLNSFVQQPFQGSEYSSYQCSRVTSGRVSPSDLPDSPIQSRPYTPKVKIKKILQFLLLNAKNFCNTNYKNQLSTRGPSTNLILGQRDL